VNGEVYKQYLLEKVIPDVKRKMPWMRGKEMFIQHDGAKAHLPAEHDAAIDQALTANRWKISLVRQPARSPFLNMCDLSFNYSLQCKAERIKFKSANLLELRDLVVGEFWKYEPELLLRQWGTLAHVYRVVMKYRGENFPNSELHGGVRQRGISYSLEAVDVANYHDCLRLVDEYYYDDAVEDFENNGDE
jgi:hypothetical protein